MTTNINAANYQNGYEAGRELAAGIIAQDDLDQRARRYDLDQAAWTTSRRLNILRRNRMGAAQIAFMSGKLDALEAAHADLS